MSNTYKNNDKSKDNVKVNAKGNVKDNLILDAMGQIDDKYILEASEIEKVSANKKIIRFVHKLTPIAAVAVAAILLLVVSLDINGSKNKPGTGSDGGNGNGVPIIGESQNGEKDSNGHYADEDPTGMGQDVIIKPTGGDERVPHIYDDALGKYRIECDIDNDGENEVLVHELQRVGTTYISALSYEKNNKVYNIAKQELGYVHVGESIQCSIIKDEGKNKILYYTSFNGIGSKYETYEVIEVINNTGVMDMNVEKNHINYSAVSSEDDKEAIINEWVEFANKCNEYLEQETLCVVCTTEGGILNSTEENLITTVGKGVNYPFKNVFNPSNMYDEDQLRKDLEFYYDRICVSSDIEYPTTDNSTEQSTLAFDEAIIGVSQLTHDIDGDGSDDIFHIDSEIFYSERYNGLACRFVLHKDHYIGLPYPPISSLMPPDTSDSMLMDVELEIPKAYDFQGYYPDELLDGGYMIECFMYSNYIVFYAEAFIDGDIWSKARVFEYIHDGEIVLQGDYELNYNRDSDSALPKALAEYYMQIFAYNNGVNTSDNAADSVEVSREWDRTQIAFVGYGNVKPVFNFFSDKVSGIGYSNEYNDIYRIMKLYVDNVVAGE